MGEDTASWSAEAWEKILEHTENNPDIRFILVLVFWVVGLVWWFFED